MSCAARRGYGPRSLKLRAGLHRIGAISDAELEKTTIRMLGKDALPKVETLSPAEIAGVRKRERREPGGARRVHERGREHGQSVGARPSVSRPARR